MLLHRPQEHDDVVKLMLHLGTFCPHLVTSNVVEEVRQNGLEPNLTVDILPYLPLRVAERMVR